jgi:hypothetical protein
VFSPIRSFLESPPHLQNQTLGASQSFGTRVQVFRGALDRSKIGYN